MMGVALVLCYLMGLVTGLAVSVYYKQQRDAYRAQATVAMDRLRRGSTEPAREPYDMSHAHAAGLCATRR